MYSILSEHWNVQVPRQKRLTDKSILPSSLALVCTDWKASSACSYWIGIAIFTANGWGDKILYAITTIRRAHCMQALIGVLQVKLAGPTRLEMSFRWLHCWAVVYNFCLALIEAFKSAVSGHDRRGATSGTAPCQGYLDAGCTVKIVLTRGIQLLLAVVDNYK